MMGLWPMLARPLCNFDLFIRWPGSPSIRNCISNSNDRTATCIQTKPINFKITDVMVMTYIQTQIRKIAIF